MDPMPAIFDISSDEEPAENEPKGDDYDWLSEILRAVDKEADDPDEVVVVREVNPRQRSKSLKPTVKDVDDDCVILDGDPDKPVAVVNDAESDSDELLIVGQKGKIACRDYPHPRHFCVKFPFSSTPHERHCDLCHCYVCDSLAPCAHWGTGVSFIDHCHATDKEETWKTQRESFKLRKDSPLPDIKFSDSTSLPQLTQVPPRDISRVAPNSMAQNQFPRQTTFRACHLTRYGTPNIISQGRSRQSRSVSGKNGFQPHIGSQQMLGIRNNSIRKDRGHSIGNLGSQFVSPNTMSKRAETDGAALAMNRSMYGSSNDINCAYASQYTQNPAQLATTNDKNDVGWQDVLPSANIEPYMQQSPSQPNMSSVFGNTMFSEPQVRSQPFPESNDGKNTPQLRNQSQNTTDSGFSDFNCDWGKNTSQDDQQPPVENLQLHSTGSANEPLPVKAFNSQFDESPKLLYNDLGFESWLLGNQSVPVVSEGSMPPDSNVICPEQATFDAGMLLFDFETSWNGLTHA